MQSPKMDESFLHFIWKFQHLNSRSLTTDAGQKITVLHPGIHNSDAGPDFSNAKIKIEDITWNGNVEIHINSKDWYRHNHQNDDAYDNVVLHVVWKNDASIQRKDNTTIPVLELKNLIDNKLIVNYQQLLEPTNEILCHNLIAGISPLIILNMKDKALAQRLENKADVIFRKIALTNGDWEEVSWRILCENFGFKTNAHPFSELAKSLPFNILKKESDHEYSVEALLFGQAGFLENDHSDSYYKVLKEEYAFKKEKYRLERRLDAHQWKFLRLRPANFPTIRLAQLSSLVKSQKNLFSFFVDFNSLKELMAGMKVKQSDYWQTHYTFEKKAEKSIGNLGRSSIENTLINTVVPLLFTYGIHKDQEELKEKAIDLLSNLKPENNFITKKWEELEIKVESAFDSQALIELFNEYCKRKKCLSCAVGANIIKTG